MFPKSLILDGFLLRWRLSGRLPLKTRMDVMERKLEDTLTCSVCQEIFEDPRQLPCGHSICLSCLQNLRDHSIDVPFRCPNCRQYFGPLIGLSKSYTLISIAEEFRELRRRKVGLFEFTR